MADKKNNNTQRGGDASKTTKRRRYTSSIGPAPSHFKSSVDAKLIQLALHKSPYFTCLDEEQIERLVAAAELKEYAPSSIVILEGCVDEDADEIDDGVRADLMRRRSSIVWPEDGPADVDETIRMEQEEEKRQELIETERSSEEAAPGEAVEKVAETVSAMVGASTDEETATSTTSNDDEADSDEDQLTPLQKEMEQARIEKRGTAKVETLPVVPPPRSGVKRSIYIVKSGHADVWYRPGFNPASLGPGTLFGEGGFLFGRQHSASVIANRHETLECWVVDFQTFRNHILPSNNMTQLFAKYATREDEHGVRYMIMDDFAAAIEQEEGVPPAMQDPTVNLRIANTYNILSKQNSSRIYLADFCLFHLLMARPDPEVDIAFLLMDYRQTGQIHIEDLQRFMEPIYPNLDLRSQFFQRYFGKNLDLSVRHHHFSQFLVDLQREIGKQAFLRAIEERGIDGYLAPTDFVTVLKTSCGWRLPTGVAERLESIYCHGPMEAGEAVAMASIRAGSLKGASVEEVKKSTEASVLADMEQREKNLGSRYFAYGDFVAFQEVLAALPGICNLIDRAQEIKQGPVSQDDFKVANRVLGLGGRLSRRQVDIIFTLFDLDRDGFVSHEDTVSVCGIDFAQRLEAVRGRNGALTFAPPPQYREEPEEKPAETNGDYLLHFSLSAFAGALGVVALHPLEIVKTRLMNQRIMKDGTGRMYLHSFDCLRQVVRAQGFSALFRGLTPQLLGVAPEKAIKLKVNDLLRLAFSSNDESGKRMINLPLEVLAGACAGACQLLVTNPMELTKTRLILQDETTQLLQAKAIKPPLPQSFGGVVRDLGFPGVYRGAQACLLRDIPFSAIYFPAYAACKSFLADQRDESQASLTDLLLAGTIAGVPAALLTTPCDVIRVRLQAIPRPGDTPVHGIRSCASAIYEQEGWQGFFRGSFPRTLRIAPQFGIALLAYEQLTQRLGFTNTAFHPPTNAPVDPRDYRTAFPATSLRPKTDDIDSWMKSFGLGGASPSNDPGNKRGRR